MSSVMISREDENGRDPEELYSLGRRFGGETKREMKSRRKPKILNTYNGDNGEFWASRRHGLGIITDMFLCGKDHRSNDLHPGEEVSESIGKVKESDPTALIKIDDQYHI